LIADRTAGSLPGAGELGISEPEINVADAQAIRILAIDDDPALHCLLERALVRQGYQVTTAIDGASGLAAYEVAPFDLLVVDYDMPGMSGLDLLRMTQQHAAPPPVIMLTGRGNERIAVEAFTLGAADYLVKDIDLAFLELLPTVIHRVLTRRKLEQERDELFAGIKESEERYRQLVESIPDGIAIVVQGRIVLINPAGLRILGAASTREALGTEFLDWLQVVTSPTETGALAEYAATTVPSSWQELSCLRHGHEPLDLELLTLRFNFQGEEATQLIFRDVTEKNQYRARLEHLATRDALTDLPNRVLFFERFQQTLEGVQRYGDVGALLFMDLDGFKEINDTCGHDVGDQVLRTVADRLREGVRHADVVARMGGDEFTVVLTKLTQTADAGVVAAKILDELRQPMRVGDRELTVGASIGISIFPKDGTAMEILMKVADHAMYMAKRAGGCRFSYVGLAEDGSPV
jgi:diguanylate cyclase (GGDEF)-like protein/PAS domain S-box-containing protein